MDTSITLEQIGTLAVETYKAWASFHRATRLCRDNKQDDYDQERLALLAAESKHKEAIRLYLEQNGH